MSLIGKNIKKIRVVKKLSQTAFSELFDLTRASIGAYEEGRAEPRVDTIIGMAKYFGISIDSLLTKELTVNEIHHFSLEKHNSIANQKKKQDVFFISRKEQKNYMEHRSEQKYLESLPRISLPGVDSKYRAFEYFGCDMLFCQSLIKNGDILIARFTPAEHQNLKINMNYVFILDNSILVRTVSQIQDKVELTAYNPCFEKAKLALNTIKECWEITSVYTQIDSSRKPAFIERVQRLENAVSDIYKKLDTLLLY